MYKFNVSNCTNTGSRLVQLLTVILSHNTYNVGDSYSQYTLIITEMLHHVVYTAYINTKHSNGTSVLQNKLLGL